MSKYKAKEDLYMKYTNRKTFTKDKVYDIIYDHYYNQYTTDDEGDKHCLPDKYLNDNFELLEDKE